MARGLILIACVLAAGVGFTVAGTDERQMARASPHPLCDRVVSTDESLPSVLDRLPEDRTVCLRRGTHEWPNGLSVGAAKTTVRSYPGEQATIRGPLRIEVTATGSVIKNLTLDGRGDEPRLSPLIYADRAVLRNNAITNGYTHICVHIDSYYDRPAPRDVVIESNRIFDCGQLPPTNHDHGIYVGDAVGTVIRDNWIHDNADRGVQLYWNADDSRVTGNVIDGNGQGVIFGGNREHSSDGNLVAHNVIANSIVRHNVEDSWGGPVGSNNVVRDNCVWSPRLDYYTGDPHQSGLAAGASGFASFENKVAEPLYVGAGRDNFKLRPSSPCAGVLHEAPGIPGP